MKESLYFAEETREAEPFRCAMFSLFPDTARNLCLLSDEQLGEITRALFAHYWRPEENYTGDNPLLQIIYRHAAREIDRYTEKCRTNSENGKKRKGTKLSEA